MPRKTPKSPKKGAASSGGSKKTKPAAKKPATKKRPPTKKKPTPRKKASPSKKSTRKTPSQTPKRSRLGRLVRFALVSAMVLFLVGALGVTGMFYVFSRDIPHVMARGDFQPKQLTRIYSSDGQVIDELFAPEGRRTVVAFEDISPHMRKAILAAEDADFYKHKGLDYYGMVRAVYYALRYNRRQGASTITQQVVKNLILTPEKRIKRKVQEIILAQQLEDNLTKDDILYMYLNQIYFGHGRYGIEEASRFYFGKSAAKLTLSEAATIAGVVQSPERLSPTKHPERAHKRRAYVLGQMWKKGFVDEPSARAAMKEPIRVAMQKDSAPALGAAPYYTAHIRRLLQNTFPDEEVAAMGLHVRTALVLDRQRDAKRALRKGLEAWDARLGAFQPIKRPKKRLTRDLERQDRLLEREGMRPDIAYFAVVTEVGKHALKVRVGDRSGTLPIAANARANPTQKPLTTRYTKGDVISVLPKEAYPSQTRDALFLFAPSAQGAIVSIDVSTRRVEALVGGYDFAQSSFNRATQARRQTGSTFKPIVYGAALKQRITTPATLWLDAPKPFKLPDGKVWNPKNSDGKYKGKLTLRRALALSRNVIAVRLVEKLGIGATQTFARSLGLRSPLTDNYTLALGSSEIPPLELVNAYTTLAARGQYAEPIFITSIHDGFGRALLSETVAQPKPAISPDVAFLTTHIMTSVLQGGTASKVGRAFKRPAAGKTGTTNASRDAWFVGFTPQKVTGVWVGNDNNAPLGRRASGGSTAAPIWLDYMLKSHANLPKKNFVPPTTGIVQARVDPKTGLLVRKDDRRGVDEYFLVGTAPTQYAPDDGDSSVSDFLYEQGGAEDEDAEE